MVDRINILDKKKVKKFLILFQRQCCFSRFSNFMRINVSFVQLLLNENIISFKLLIKSMLLKNIQ